MGRPGPGDRDWWGARDELGRFRRRSSGERQILIGATGSGKTSLRLELERELERRRRPYPDAIDVPVLAVTDTRPKPAKPALPSPAEDE